MHKRTRFRWPIPQFTEQLENVDHGLQPPLIGQGRVVSQSAISSAGPWHGSPPTAGLGFSHIRDLSCIPIPQVAEQPVHEDQGVQSPSTWQGTNVSQPSTSVTFPLQGIPPKSGSGLSHTRFLSRKPIPQCTEHSLQPYQWPQLPCTGHGAPLSHSLFSVAKPMHRSPP